MGADSLKSGEKENANLSVVIVLKALPERDKLKPILLRVLLGRGTFITFDYWLFRLFKFNNIPNFVRCFKY